MLTTRYILPPSLCRRGPFLMQDMGNHNRRTRSLQLCCMLRRKMPVILQPRAGWVGKKLKASYLLFGECEFTVLCVSFHEEPRYQVPGTVLYQVQSGCWILCGIRRVNNFWKLPQNVWPNFPQSRKHLTSQSTSFESSIFKFSISSLFLSSQQILQ